MQIIRERIKRFFHIWKHILKGEGGKHEAIDYSNPSDIQILGSKIKRFKVIHIRCTCGMVFYDKNSDKLEYENRDKKGA